MITLTCVYQAVLHIYIYMDIGMDIKKGTVRLIEGERSGEGEEVNKK